MTKTSIQEELNVLEKANYQSLDEKRITITAWLVNKLDEQQKQIGRMKRLTKANIMYEMQGVLDKELPDEQDLEDNTAELLRAEAIGFASGWNEAKKQDSARLEKHE